MAIIGQARSISARYASSRLGSTGSPGELLARPGDGAHLDPFEHAHPGGHAVAAAELERGRRRRPGRANTRPRARAAELLGRAVEAEPAAVEEEDARGGGLDVARDVGREDDDALARLLEEDLAEAAARLDVEAGGRLVDDQDRRRAEQGAGDAHPLAHAARVVAHLAAGVLGEADGGEQALDLGPRAAAGRRGRAPGPSGRGTARR